MMMKEEIDLSKAVVGGMAHIIEGGQGLNLKITSIKPDVIGQIGLFQFNLTKIQEAIRNGNKDYVIDQLAKTDTEFYGYDPIRDTLVVTDHVHKFRVGNKDAEFLINYHNKLWTCKITGLFHPNSNIALYGFAGGVYYSVDSYIEEHIKQTMEIVKSHCEQSPEYKKELYG